MPADLGLLMVRVPAGLLLAGHGAQKLFGWFGGDGLDATGTAFESMGYPRGRAMATLAGTSEIGAGAGLVTGLATPLAAAGVIGMMTNAAVAAHAPAGLWAQNGGYEYPLVLGTTAAGLATRGPGSISVDAALGRGRGSVKNGLAAIGLGLATAAAALSARRSTGPASSPQTGAVA